MTGIAAPIRCIVKFKGRRIIPGATAMHYRHDALLGGAELALAIEQAAIDVGHSTVATVGNLSAKPGVMNVVPGYWAVNCWWISEAFIAKPESRFSTCYKTN